MNDPHVSKLYYRAETGETVDYDKAEPLEHDCEGFSLHLNDDRLVVSMKDHYANGQAARDAVEPLLRAWEIDVALKRGLGDLCFKYESPEVIDRAPKSADGPRVVQAQVAVAFGAALDATAHVSCLRYPKPPADFAATPDVETLWHRYRGYLEGREPLPAMGYFCLTMLKALAGDRGKAAKKYAISKRVLNRLGELTSERGDHETARKYGLHKPLSRQEKMWMEEVIKAIIRQLGRIEAGKEPDQLTMDDLPRLS